jgi:hypothetical protein
MVMSNDAGPWPGGAAMGGPACGGPASGTIREAGGMGEPPATGRGWEGIDFTAAVGRGGEATGCTGAVGRGGIGGSAAPEPRNSVLATCG